VLALLLSVYHTGVSLTKNRGSGNPVVTTYTLELVAVVCNRVVYLFVIRDTVEIQDDIWKVDRKFEEGSARVVLVQSMTAYGRVEFSCTQFSRLREIAKSDY
jgi:hypothetical protein